MLNAIDRNAPTRGPALPARRSWFTGPTFRYAAVFVGGLLLSALLFGPETPRVVSPDVSELVGTIGGTRHGSPIDRIELDLEQVSGAVNAYKLDGQLVVELDLMANEPIEIVATHQAQTVHFSLGSQPGSSSERLIWLPTAGQPANGAGAVELEIYGGGGRLLHRESLRT